MGRKRRKISVISSRLKAFTSFTDAFTSALNAAWKSLRGTFSVSSGVATTSTPTTSYPLSAVKMSKSNVTVQAKSMGQGTGLAIWSTDSGNWWGVVTGQKAGESCNCQTCNGSTCNAYGSTCNASTCNAFNTSNCNGYTCNAYQCNSSTCNAYNCNASNCATTNGSNCNAYSCASWTCNAFYCIAGWTCTGGWNATTCAAWNSSCGANACIPGTQYCAGTYNGATCTGYTAVKGNCKTYNAGKTCATYYYSTNCTGYTPGWCNAPSCTTYCVYTVNGGCAYNNVSNCNSNSCIYGVCTSSSCSGYYTCDAWNTSNCSSWTCNAFSCASATCNSSSCTSSSCSGGWNAVYCNSATCNAWTTYCATSFNYTYSCNCSTCYPAVVRVLQSVSNTVTEMASYTLSTIANSLKVITSGSTATIKPYSDNTLSTQIGSDLTYTAAGGAKIDTMFGIVVAPSAYNQGNTLDDFTATSN